MSRKYKFHNKEGLCFVSFATVNWTAIFTGQNYYTFLEESINYCRFEIKRRKHLPASARL